MAVTYSTEIAQPPFEGLSVISFFLGVTLFCSFMTSAPNAEAHLVQRHFLEPTSVAEENVETTGPLNITTVGPPPSGLSEAQFQTALIDAISAWNTVICSSAQLHLITSQNVSERSTVIIAVDKPESPCLPEGFIGFTTHSCPAHDGRLTVLLNDTEFDWHPDPSPFFAGSPPRVDARSVLTHELGHVLGIPHLFDDPLATMAPTYLLDGGQRTLSAADKQAVCGRYPSGHPECTTDSECLSRRCVLDNEDGGVCQEVRGKLGSYCGLELLHCEDFCQISSKRTGTGYCSRECTEDSDCGCETCDATYRCTFHSDSGRDICLADASHVEPGCGVTRPETSPTGRPSHLILVIAFLTLSLGRRSSLSADPDTPYNPSDKPWC